MDYTQCEAILEEDSDDIHPNIEESTFRRWMKTRKDAVRESLVKRRTEILSQSLQDGIPRPEIEELEKITKLLREKIIETVSETHIAQASVPDEMAIVVTDPPKHLIHRVDKILDLLANTESVCEYIQDILKYKATIQSESENSQTPALFEELHAFLLDLGCLNIDRKNYRIAKRLCVYAFIMELDVSDSILLSASNLQAVEKQALVYFQLVIDHVKNKE
ncbi:hypothetical protein NECID01_0684 [Nematocida sp. AWRm77]|nr:hypothetical protein NECID01_0684 [Nematocida sp. AWRm77]